MRKKIVETESVESLISHLSVDAQSCLNKDEISYCIKHGVKACLEKIKARLSLMNIDQAHTYHLQKAHAYREVLNLILLEDIELQAEKLPNNSDNAHH